MLLSVLLLEGTFAVWETGALCHGGWNKTIHTVIHRVLRFVRINEETSLNQSKVTEEI